MENKKEINNSLLESVSGGAVHQKAQAKGAPIMRKCPICGKEFKAGNGGVNHAMYPLKTICPYCEKKQKH